MLPNEEVVIVSRRPAASRLILLALGFLVGVGLWSFSKEGPDQGTPPGARPNQVFLKGLEEGAGINRTGSPPTSTT